MSVSECGFVKDMESKPPIFLSVWFQNIKICIQHYNKLDTYWYLKKRLWMQMVYQKETVMQT